MKKYASLLFLFFVSLTVSAQTVYFSQSHTEDGEPIGAKNEWEIKPGGTGIYVVYRQNKSINDDKLYLFIDKFDDKEFKPFDSKTVNVNEGANWGAYNFRFSEPGRYRASFMTTGGEKLASETATLKYDKEYTGRSKPQTGNYYDYNNAYFVETVIDGKPLNRKNSVSLDKGEGNLLLYMNNNKPIDSDVIHVEIWKKDRSRNDFDRLVEKKKFAIEPDWPDTYFPYTFQSKGQYKFSVYNDNMVHMGDAYITVR